MSITRAPWVSPAIPSPSRRTSIDWRPAARASTRPTATRRSACPRAPRLPRAATCTSLAPGTTPSPMTGAFPAGATRCSSSGHRVDSIGKLHYRNAEDPTGFDHQYHPMHIYGGHGMVWGALRDGKADFTERAHVMLDPIGPGTSKYNIYDDRIATEAETWIARAAREEHGPAVGAVRRLRCSALPADGAARTFLDLYPVDKMPLAAPASKGRPSAPSLARGQPSHPSRRRRPRR